MKNFFGSKRFKILIGIAALLIGFMLRSASSGGFATFTENAISIVTIPFSRLSSMISGTASDFFDKFVRAAEIYDENEALKEEIRNLTEQLVNYETFKAKNEQYEQYLDLKKQNTDFLFESAMVIGRDTNARFYSFTIDKGSADGISPHDPVISADGLVGFISEVSYTNSTVTTILDVAADVGAYDIRTRDIGIVTGDITLAFDGFCKITLLPRDSGVSVGDVIVTSGMGGIFPEGLVVGTVNKILPESNGISLYAVIRPVSNIKTIKEVFVITEFEGQQNPNNDSEN
ncbi:MAG: rod shape-determining protein MreC [Oscillospiraceae bacterium]|nr:rod shape-determining protein MreC [Oscillospiraceae bacterium]